MKRFSIRQYVVWLTLIPLLIMAVGLEMYFLRDRSALLDKDLMERGKLIARQLASSSEYGVFASNQSFLQNLAQGVLQQPDVRKVTIVNAASESLAEAGELSPNQGEALFDVKLTMPPMLGTYKDSAGNKVKEWVNRQNPLLSSGESLWIYQPILPVQVALDDLDVKSAVQQVGAVIIEMSWERTKKLKSEMLWVMIGATVLIFAFSFFLRYLVSRRITSPICELSDAVERIGKGHFETSVAVSSHVTELSNLAQGINDMTAQLQQVIAEHKSSERQLRNLSAHLQIVREEEKASVAREIHDHLGGTLTALKMDMNWLVDKMSVNHEVNPFLQHIESMSQLLDTATIATRRVITDLRPTILDDLGLCAALEWQAGQFQQRTGIECLVTCYTGGSKYELDKMQTINLFRIFQESLTNVTRHSGASQVEVDLYYEDEKIVMTINDNGCGLPQGHTIAPTSYGMLGMRERVEQMQGKIDFCNLPGGGFSVRVILAAPPIGNQIKVEA